MSMVLSSWQNYCESSPGSLDECRTAPSDRQPSDQAKQLGLRVRLYAARVYTHHRHLFFITQPESWYSFYRPTEARKLSRPSWLVTYRNGLPVHRRWGTFIPNLDTLGLWVLELFAMYATDRRTDKSNAYCPLPTVGGIIINIAAAMMMRYLTNVTSEAKVTSTLYVLWLDMKSWSQVQHATTTSDYNGLTRSCRAMLRVCQ